MTADSRLTNTPVTRSRGLAAASSSFKGTPAKGRDPEPSTSKAPSLRKGKPTRRALSSSQDTPLSSPQAHELTAATLVELLQSSPELEEEFQHEDLDALAAAICTNLEARLRQPLDVNVDDGIRAIFENTKTKRSESYGAFVVENGVVQLGPLPVGHDSRNVIASIANNNRATKSSKENEPLKTYAMPTTRAITTGADWFHMKSPELTPELKTDLAIIANRAYLDPKRFYKKEGTKKLATHFQVGTVVAGAHEFFSSLSHKERSRNFVEEIYKDTSTKSYLKRKYGQIQATKSMKGHSKKYRGKRRGTK